MGEAKGHEKTRAIAKRSIGKAASGPHLNMGGHFHDGGRLVSRVLEIIPAATKGGRSVSDARSEYPNVHGEHLLELAYV